MNSTFTNKLKKFCFISFAIILIAELFLFNYKAFLINPFNSSEYQQLSFAIDDADIEGLSSLGNTKYEVTEDDPTLIFTMDKPVETMYFDVVALTDDGKLSPAELITNISYATESYNKLRSSSKAFTIVEAVPSSKYVTCSYFGNVKQIQLKLNVDEGATLQIRNFSVNKKIPMNFSFVRVLFLFVLSCLIFVFLKYPSFKEPTDMRKRSHAHSVYFTITAFLLLIFFTYNMYIGEYDWWGHKSGNQMTQELVDAFSKGQVSLLDEVPAELLELENPYDWSERQAAGIKYKWDHLLFEGKYYSYYGIAPVITLFLPYHLITGYYFPSSLACLMYSMVAALFLCLCYMSIIKNWFSKTPLRLTILGLIATMFSSCVIINVYATQFYEIAQSSALCFLLIGFYFMLNSNIFMNKKIRLPYLFLSSLFVSLAVLSRATSAVYAFVMVFWIIYGYLQYMKDNSGNKKAALKYIAMSISPYVVFGLIQMTYNYLRFGNPFDFGIQYTLTIYDYLNIDMHLGIVMISIVNFLFSVPIINTKFPFIHANMDYLGINGYYFVATRPVFGVIPSVLPTLALLYAPKLAKNFNLKDKLKLFLIWFLPGIVFPVILVAMTWQYGYAMRYNADFGWQMCLAALVVIFYVYNRLDNELIKKWLFRVFFAATTWCVLCYMASIFSKNPLDAVADNIDGALIYYKIRSLVYFWS